MRFRSFAVNLYVNWIGMTARFPRNEIAGNLAVCFLLARV